ncbi:hypothetical protein [Micropruina sp.]|uniref:hypothetical protein n=1 Tax=Micropruina sp. TaxID=2737536 RepID=UPI0039E71A3A
MAIRTMVGSTCQRWARAEQTPPNTAPERARRSGVSSMPATLVGDQRRANWEDP